MPNRASAIVITDIKEKGIHFFARRDVIFAQLDAEMAELRKIGGIVTKEGSVGIGRAEITPGGQIVRGKWKWKYQKKGDASVGDDPHLNDGTARREQGAGRVDDGGRARVLVLVGEEHGGGAL